MTAATPGTTELLALKSRLDNANLRYSGGTTTADIALEDRRVLAILVEGLIAAKPDEDGVKDIRQTVLKVYGFSDEAIASDWIKRSHAYSIATQIAAALSTTGKPKP